MRPDRLSWEERDSAAFLEYGDCFVPERELQIELFCGLIPEPKAGALVVDLCCGEALLSEAILRRHPACRILALDGSEAMRERAARRLRVFGERAEVREFDLASPRWRGFGQPLHACVSAYAIHHLGGGEKRALFHDVARLLAPGGVFAVADLIEPASRQGRELAAKQWDACVRERSLRLRGDLSAYEYFVRSNWNYFSAPGADPVDHPSVLLEQLDWLREAGFEMVDVYWMKAGMALFGGRKPAAD